MISRILDFSDSPARLNVRNATLVIQTQGPEVTMPLGEVAALVLSHPQVTCTHPVLSGVTAAGGVIVVCNEKHIPTGMMLPLQGHVLQSERMRLQAAASAPMRKRLWKQIVCAKITAQASLLNRIEVEEGSLLALCSTVRSGDPNNIEAQAARRYWPLLFGSDFRRERDAEDQNRFLNYGYAVLRAIVTRAICGAGLHPGLGLHHHNRYDPFCLADDLMEPFRPLVDEAVHRFCATNYPHSSPANGDLEPTKRPSYLLDKNAKAALLNPLLGYFSFKGESRTLFDWLARTTSSMADALEERSQPLFLPLLTPVTATINP